MSYMTAIFYAVKCDRCGEHYDGEYEYYGNKNDALDAAQAEGWAEINDKHYCPNCFEEKDDEGVPLKRLPQIYWTAREACHKLGTIPYVKFAEDCVTVASGYVSSQKLVEGVIDWMLRLHNSGQYGVYTAECETLVGRTVWPHRLIVKIKI